MPQPPEPAPASEPAPPPEGGEPVAALVIAVERSGGFAGLVRRWSVTPPARDAVHWRRLIDECPWDAATAAGDPAGADRFCWSLTAVEGDLARAARLAEHEVEGPWRTLVDAVRAAASSAEE